MRWTLPWIELFGPQVREQLQKLQKQQEQELTILRILAEPYDTPPTLGVLLHKLFHRSGDHNVKDILMGLISKGLVMRAFGENGPTYEITPDGRGYLVLMGLVGFRRGTPA